MARIYAIVALCVALLTIVAFSLAAIAGHWEQQQGRKNDNRIGISRLLRGFVNTNRNSDNSLLSWNKETVESRQLNVNFVSIQGKKETCFGSLIHVDLVLTSAQCLPHLKVNDTTYIGFPSLFKAYRIDSLFPHPNFDFPYYDYLLLKLEDPVPNTPPRIISLDSTVPSIGDQALVIGPTESAIGAQPTDIDPISLEILNKTACQQRYQPPIIGPLMICATSNTNTTGRCRKDAGSPMIDNNGFQIGILSTGQGGCSRDGSPAIFSRVSWASDWIVNVTCTVSAFPPVFCERFRGDGISEIIIETEAPTPAEDSNPFAAFQNRDESSEIIIETEAPNPKEDSNPFAAFQKRGK